MKTWVIMTTMSMIIRFGDYDFDDQDDDDDYCDEDDGEIPPCHLSHQADSSPAYSCHACNKNQSIVIDFIGMQKIHFFAFRFLVFTSSILYLFVFPLFASMPVQSSCF